MRGYGSRGTASIAGSGALSCGRDWDGGWCGGGDGNQDRMAWEQDGRAILREVRADQCS